MGAVTHHVGEGRFFIMSTSRICTFFATMIAVVVGPAVLQGLWGRRLGASTAPTGSASASAAVAVVAFMVWSVGEL